MTRMISWFLAAAMAIWFGVLAYRGNRRWVLWMVGGALISLVVSTIVFGLCEAVFIPMSHKDYVVFRIESIALQALAVVFFVGIPGTIVHRRIRSSGRKNNDQS